MSKSALLPIEKTFRSALDTYFNKSPFFIAAVSGGADSMCMLYLLRRFEIEALVVHINYGKRGEESDKDAQLVEQMANEWGFDCQTIKAEGAEAADGNFQEWAREFRYDVFRALCDEYEAEGIVLAHHKNDQVETILQKQFRGAGLESWSAMNVWNGELFRPLLGVSRTEIENYCEKKAIPYRTDSSNLESDFARNFLRNEWLPALEAHFPGWQENVLRIAGQASLFEAALEWIEKQISSREGGIDRRSFLELDTGLACAVLLHMIKKELPDVQLSREALKQVENAGQLQTGSRLQLSKQLFLMRDREDFRLEKESNQEEEHFLLELDRLKEGPFTSKGLEFYIEEYKHPDFDKALYLDVARLSWPLSVRKWQPGDRFHPLGMQGHQKIADYLTNRKISALHKKDALVIETFDQIICAVIFPPIQKSRPPGAISEMAKCGGDTRQCLIIKQI